MVFKIDKKKLLKYKSLGPNHEGHLALSIFFPSQLTIISTDAFDFITSKCNVDSRS